MMKKIIILGATGSIGKATLDVVANNPKRLQVVGLAVNRNCDLLIEQIIRFRPQAIAVEGLDCAERISILFPGLQIFRGPLAATALVRETLCDVVVAAISGMAGLRPVIAAAELGRVIALANKESLVAAGELLMVLVKDNGAELRPVDSEHSALWQGMLGWPRQAVRKIILTASGGPFLGKEYVDLRTVTKEQALNHPTWKMGGKISVDSATLMNKGLEVIEAHHLFGFGYEDIEILVHPESVVHSIVEFVDGAQLAQCSLPDMRIPIQLALSYPERWPAQFVANHYAGMCWNFSPPDLKTFRCLSLALASGRKGGAYPIVLNAANEVAVESFLQGGINFLAIADIIEEVLSQQIPLSPRTLADVFAIDEWARRQTVAKLKQRAV